MRIRILIMLILMYSEAFSQKNIEGKITDDQQKGLSAQVKILTKSDQLILKFTQSKSDGFFKITVPEHADTLILSVSKMGYETQSIVLDTLKSSFNFILEKTDIALEEFVVKAPPIRKYGDTLVYKVSEFSNDADRSIGDVISKLPGVEVDPNGQILYQGKPINRYYINDLNLMNGRYGLVNSNLAHQKVVSVEILENHQPIRLLDSLQLSERAAINIKLKNNVTQNTNIKAGLGAKPLLWEGNVTPMVFLPKFQVIGSIQSNNSGAKIANQLQSFIPYSNEVTSANKLNLVSVSSPPLSSNWWLDNTSHLGSLSLLKKTKSQKEIKFNTHLLLDKNQQIGGSVMTYLLENNEISYAESIRNKYGENKFDAELELLNNSSKKYFRNLFKISSIWESNNGLSTRSNAIYNQANKNKQMSVSNHFNQMVKIKNKLYNFYSNSQYLQSNQDLVIQFKGLDSLKNPVQSLSVRTFNTHNYIGFTKKFNQKWNAGFTPTFNLNHNLLESSLENHFIKSDTTNDIRWTNAELSSDIFLNYRLKKWNISGRTPIVYNWIKYSALNDFSKVNVNPNLNFRWRNDNDFGINFGSSYQTRFSRFGELHPGFIMTDYLSVVKKDGNIRSTKSFTSNLGFDYKNIITGFNIFGNYMFIKSTQNMISQTLINQDGSSINTNIEKENSRKSHQFSTQISKYFFTNKSRLILNLLISQNKSDRYLNGVIGVYTYSNFNPSLTLSNNYFKHFDLLYKLNFNQSKNVSTEIQTINQNLSLGVTPIKNHRVGLNAEQYKISSNNINFVLANLDYRITIPKLKQDLEFSIQNIGNKKTFESITISDFYEYQSYFQLRPRQIMIKTRFNF